MDQHKIQPWILRLVLIVLGSIALFVLAVYLFWRLSGIVTLVTVALFVSFALEPFVNFLIKKGWKRNLASIFIILSFSFAALLVFGAMIPLIVQQFDDVARQAPLWAEKLSVLFNNNFDTKIDAQNITSQVSDLSSIINNYGINIAGNVFGISKQIILGVFQVFAVLMLTYYFVADAPKLRRILCSFLPAKQQKLVLNTWELAIDKTGSYMYSRGLLGLISALATFIVLTILGVPFALPLAIWMGIVSQFLPVIGTYIGAIVPLFIALLQSPETALLLLVFISIYQLFENYLLGPKITAHTMEIHPAITLVAVLIGASLAGVAGALIALPIAAIAQESIKVYLKRHELIESELFQHSLSKRQKKKKAN
ncbi:AI-2E family transporter [Candidatus Saccharibacteria bacterium]|jgi:predicted PurR-regulated permease PerM|nr:AI-2E family transporter [Candidatus Saccharibacteria bacterium]MBP7834574.1 AI-2E family transporter [Candidatus Saccharibacteria bacterium]